MAGSGLGDVAASAHLFPLFHLFGAAAGLRFVAVVDSSAVARVGEGFVVELLFRPPGSVFLFLFLPNLRDFGLAFRGLGLGVGHGRVNGSHLLVRFFNQ